MWKLSWFQVLPRNLLTGIPSSDMVSKGKNVVFSPLFLSPPSTGLLPPFLSDLIKYQVCQEYRRGCKDRGEDALEGLTM